MNFALFIIDAQNEVIKGGGRNEGMSVCNDVCGLRTKLAFYNVPTVHFAFLRNYPITPTVGTMREINGQFIKKTNLSLIGKRFFCFGIPVGEDDLVVIKNRFSACSPQIVRFLRERDIDAVVFGGFLESKLSENDSKSCVTSSAIDFSRAGFLSIIASELTNVRLEMKPSYFIPIYNSALQKIGEKKHTKENLEKELRRVFLLHQRMIKYKNPQRIKRYKELGVKIMPVRSILKMVQASWEAKIVL